MRRDVVASCNNTLSSCTPQLFNSLHFDSSSSMDETVVVDAPALVVVVFFFFKRVLLKERVSDVNCCEVCLW